MRDYNDATSNNNNSNSNSNSNNSNSYSENNVNNYSTTNIDADYFKGIVPLAPPTLPGPDAIVPLVLLPTNPSTSPPPPQSSSILLPLSSASSCPLVASSSSSSTATTITMNEGMDNTLSTLAMDSTTHSSSMMTTTMMMEDMMKNVDRPEFISVSIHKPTPDFPLGIGLTTNDKDDDGGGDNKGVYLGTISPSSLLLECPVATGDEVISINGIKCKQQNATFARNIIRDADQIVTMVLRNTAVSRTRNEKSKKKKKGILSTRTKTKKKQQQKESKEQKSPQVCWSQVVKPYRDIMVGIVVSGEDGNLRIERTNEHGLMKDSLLKEGDRLLRINDIDCTDSKMSREEAILIIRTLEGVVRFVTESIVEV